MLRGSAETIGYLCVKLLDAIFIWNSKNIVALTYTAAAPHHHRHNKIRSHTHPWVLELTIALVNVKLPFMHTTLYCFGRDKAICCIYLLSINRHLKTCADVSQALWKDILIILDWYLKIIVYRPFWLKSEVTPEMIDVRLPPGKKEEYTNFLY